MKNILFVDDESSILNSLRRALEEDSEDEYNIYLAGDGETALNILAENRIDLVISDMRMPMMDGYMLLRTVKDRYPGTIRVILSGYAEEKQVVKTLQYNIAKTYILKPWSNIELIKTINKLFKTVACFKSKHILELFNGFEDLPTIKASYQRIMGLIENDAEINVISSEVEKDQSIATRLLHIVNSAFYGVKTGSVKQAVTMLGMQNTRNIIMTSSLFEALGQKTADGVYSQAVWDHSFKTNSLVKLIYERMLKKKIPEGAEAAGLLHNIGVVFLINTFQADYKKTISCEEAEPDHAHVETETFGLNHQEAGGYLLDWWDLPYQIVESAMFHHNPLDESVLNKELLCVIHLAQYYTWQKMQMDDCFGLEQRVFDELGVTQAQFEEKLAICWEELG